MSETPCAAFTDVFSPEQIDRIIATGEKAIIEAGGIDRGPISHRQCSVAWLRDEWLTVAFQKILAVVNDAYFQFDLDGFDEPFQYTLYGLDDHYGWHMDQGPKTSSIRKLSFTLQLSDPSEYEDGELQIQAGSDVLTMPKAKGQLIVFPSWMLHQVTPVTSGVRRSLVAWASGPAFR